MEISWAGTRHLYDRSGTASRRVWFVSLCRLYIVFVPLHGVQSCKESTSPLYTVLSPNSSPGVFNKYQKVTFFLSISRTVRPETNGDQCAFNLGTLSKMLRINDVLILKGSLNAFWDRADAATVKNAFGKFATELISNPNKILSPTLCGRCIVFCVLSPFRRSKGVQRGAATSQETRVGPKDCTKSACPCREKADRKSVV